MATTPSIEEASALRINKPYPNPSTSQFNLQVQGSGREPIVMQVFDYAGRIIETRSGINSNSTIQFGQNYAKGMYVVRVTQGKQTADTKVTKM